MPTINPATGQVTGITLTNPGIGYTGTPTFALAGGGATTPAVITGSAPTANTSGGMAFQGGGTTTLSGVSTYTGPTTVRQGTLALVAGTALTGNLNANSQLILGPANLVNADGSASAPTLTVTGPTTTGGTQTFNGLLVNSTNATITDAVGATGIASNLVLGAYSRNAGGTVNFTAVPAAGSITVASGAGQRGAAWCHGRRHDLRRDRLRRPVARSQGWRPPATVPITPWPPPRRISTLWGSAGRSHNRAVNALRFNNAAAATATLPAGAFSLGTGSIPGHRCRGGQCRPC